MISVADLLTDNRVPGNYFAFDVYIQSDLDLGLLENRRGDRLLAMPFTLIEAMYAGLDKETGLAARLVLFNCGKWWGKNFYSRFCEEVSDYYSTPIADMSMIDFLQAFKQCWSTHGWGKIELEQRYQQRGFLIIQTTRSPFAEFAPDLDRPTGFLEAGILQTVFSQLTGRDLHCLQTACESMGAECNYFLIGLPERVKPVAEMVEQKKPHEEIMESLCQ